jgi:hypothetical protein
MSADGLHDPELPRHLLAFWTGVGVMMVRAEAEYGRGGQLSREAEYQSSVITTDRPAPSLAVFAEH